MDNLKKMPMWRKVLIVLCSIICLVCTILIVSIDDILNTRDVFDNHFNDLGTNIGNIKSRRDYIRIGNENWYHNDIDKIKTDTEFGELERYFSYRIIDEDDRLYGEESALLIYGIRKKLLDDNIDRDTFYNKIYQSLSSDTTLNWKKTYYFKPLFALSTGPSLSVEFPNKDDQEFYDNNEDIEYEFKEKIIIFANDKIYCFYFSNDKLMDKFNVKGEQAFNLFNERCVSIVRDFDFLSYQLWEKDLHKKDKWTKLLFSLILFFGSFVFILSLRKIGRNNMQARKWFFYCAFWVIVVIIVGILIIAAFINYSYHNFKNVVCFSSLAILINSGLSNYLSIKTNEDYNPHYLIPDKFKMSFNVGTEFKKRLMMIFLFYPIFIFASIPIIGFYAIVFYILPILLILGLIWTVCWLFMGRRLDSNLQKSDESKARLYCRHCGKLIDADSSFCKHCGKKL